MRPLPIRFGRTTSIRLRPPDKGLVVWQSDDGVEIKVHDKPDQDGWLAIEITGREFGEGNITALSLGCPVGRICFVVLDDETTVS